MRQHQSVNDGRAIVYPAKNPSLDDFLTHLLSILESVDGAVQLGVTRDGLDVEMKRDLLRPEEFIKRV